MKIKKVKLSFSDIFVIFSSWTRITFLNRISISDFFGVASILKQWILDKKKVLIPPIIKAYFAYILFLSLGLIVSKRPINTLIELSAQIFLFLMLIVLINKYRSEEGFRKLINLLALGSLISFAIGVLDVNSSILGFSKIVEREGPNVAVATFRNSGQAGAYALITLSVLIPYRVSGMYKEIGKSEKHLVNFSILFSILGLFLTVKIASYIGFLFGITIWILTRLLIKYPKKILKFSVVLFFLFFAFNFFIMSNDSWASWFNWKISGRGQGFAFEDSFMESNWGLALDVFKKNLLFGSGLGAFGGVFNYHEVHSTYFKYLGETGLVGTLGYLLFMGAVTKLFYIKGDNINKKYKEFMMNSIPFFMGCLVSWVYTYHMRKREFIIMVAIFYIGNWLSFQKGDVKESE